MYATHILVEGRLIGTSPMQKVYDAYTKAVTIGDYNLFDTLDVTENGDCVFGFNLNADDYRIHEILVPYKVLRVIDSKGQKSVELF